MPDPALPTTRRAALAGLLALVAASACDVDDLRPPEDQATPTAPTSDAPPPDSDEALVGAMATAIVEALEVAGRVRRRFPELEPSVAPFARMHRAHFAALDTEVQPGASASVPSSSGAAVRQLRRTERRLQDQLVGAAVAAGSGALARLFASMSASVAQHLAGLELSLKDQP